MAVKNLNRIKACWLSVTRLTNGWQNKLASLHVLLTNNKNSINHISHE